MHVESLIADVIAILVLVFAFYLPRHKRKELAVALLGVNVGVLAVTAALSQTNVGAGLGLGLFGVLSIIRLRSDELKQHEIAYYFASLTIGLVGGLTELPIVITASLMVLIVMVLGVADIAIISRSTVNMTMTLDRALPKEENVREYVEDISGRKIKELSVTHIDLVNDKTVVDVRFLP
ncbi:MAG: DUF4956 domain-containing protein [Actinomycetaceae bacterium]|nr:DUF4956 domain-containing protein [Actinomycetaceae bacterium]